MTLKLYARKRNFEKTAEPRAERASGAPSHRFVIQKHAASRLHYDFRLEIGGALKSWAVPKGVPVVKGEKRLAVQVEDHPVSYIDFEGTIPKGQYGGGTVMVWDKGTFDTPEQSPAKALAAGKLHFSLHSEKLEGEWYLVRLRDEKQWLLIRGGNDMRPISKKRDDTSALSGKSMKELSTSNRSWESSTPVKPSAKPLFRNRNRLASTTKLSDCLFIEPMKARLLDLPPPGEWIYEIKFDGFRAMAIKEKNHTCLFSRNEKDFGEKFPEIAEAVAEIKADDAIIDGEIVALDDQGRSSFQLLQAFEMGEKRPPLFFYAFDLLRLNGEDLQRQPLMDRKARLEKLLSRPASVIRYSASLGSDGKALLKQAQKLGLEGLIGKRVDSLYEPGRRSGAWIKLKLHQEQEFIIGGYTNPEGSRPYFGALLVGYYEGKQLLFSGKAGTGFDHLLLHRLHTQLESIAQTECPFVNLPEKSSAGRVARLTASEMKKCHWVQPRMVCQLKYSEWTKDGKLRQPVFLGLREDKEAKEVVREKPQ